MGAAQQTVSVIVHRSRILDQHHAWVRVGDVDAGYRDLRTGRVHCRDESLATTVAHATAPLMTSPVGSAVPAPARASSTAELYRSALAAARAVA